MDAVFKVRHILPRWIVAAALIGVVALVVAGCFRHAPDGDTPEERAYNAKTQPLSTASWEYQDFEHQTRSVPRNFDSRSGGNAYRDEGTPQFGLDTR